MPQIIIMTDYNEIIEQIDVASGDFATSISRVSLLHDLREAVERAEEIQEKDERE